MLTEQQFFDGTIKHLHTQGRRAGHIVVTWNSPEFKCMYLDRSGGKCGIGVWIPADKYHLALEGMSAREIYRDHPEVINEISHIRPDLVISMQALHDVATDIKALKDGAIRRSLTFNLDLTYFNSLNWDHWEG